MDAVLNFCLRNVKDSPVCFISSAEDILLANRSTRSLIPSDLRNRDSAVKLVQREAAGNRSPANRQLIPYKDFDVIRGELCSLDEHDINMKYTMENERTGNSTSFPSKPIKTFAYCGEAFPGPIGQAS